MYCTFKTIKKLFKTLFQFIVLIHKYLNLEINRLAVRSSFCPPLTALVHFYFPDDQRRVIAEHRLGAQRELSHENDRVL